ncbi:winged helix-turn-helix domain-containing protein [Streptomyces sp. NBC_00237]|uniref:ArsR/SmtB family transcription factor n=1 Tax=Streptomyces sp. NBC_00237 TaxID=2975687 RepID=UPI0022503E58|nr:DUF5937 family protein [Streptomyces sp. NBC_00237]MCX5207270.1 winged helix-turn-helix domain-containing protein [Streptomyces sp. NBC_00237]
MLELEFAVADVARTRFAVSPLWEAVASVRVVRDAAAHQVHLPWVRQVRDRLDGARAGWRMLSDLAGSGTGCVLPSFLSPPPCVPLPGLDLELAALRAVPAEAVRRDLAELPRTATTEMLRSDPHRGLIELADAVEVYWDLALAPYWPRVRTLLEADIAYRARRLAEGGASRLFDDLDPLITWSGERLRVGRRHDTRTRSLGGQGLLLMPSAFAWPHVISKVSPDWQPAVRYPPRGVGTLWECRGAAAPEALAALIGRSRALVLAALESPTSTTALAERTGLSGGGVSQHLSVLKSAGLVEPYRTGRFVLYARTATAETLLAGLAGSV